MFDVVLVANRGEIAVRVLRTLRRLGIGSVAVHSDADTGARHVREADVAVRLGPAAARESYLSIERVLDAAARTGAQAIHPGYGFLSENAEFAEACAAAGVVLVGPSPSAMRTMGDKIRAKQTVAAAGVPVVPGRTEPGLTDDDLAAAAVRVGFPVLVKPSAGGGGKGMHVARSAGELVAALPRARREAAASFGDDTLFLERYLDRPRHIEVQVVADTHGTTLHLGERECSLQRRHQKVIEEAPSALLDPDQRERYGRLAVATARAVDYTGAGTVELIVDAAAPDSPFFLEMNTRLQVEHPVTELVTGLDLVELQLRAAAGEPLGLAQSSVRFDGHAVEARLYAEDPSRDFLPTGGKVLRLQEPTGPGVRVDSSLLEGLEVGSTYDPMLSKVIAWAPDRAGALARLDRALADTVVLGVTTNVAFLRALLADPDVIAGELDTGLIERRGTALTQRPVPAHAYVAAGLVRLLALQPDSTDLWAQPSGWRVGGPAPLRLDVAGPDGERLRLEVTGPVQDALVRVGDAEPVHAGLSAVGAAAATGPAGPWVPPAAGSGGSGSGSAGPWVPPAVIAGRGSGSPVARPERAARAEPELLLSVDGVTRPLLAAVDGATTWLHAGGQTWGLVTLARERRLRDGAAADAEVRSPMPGTVVAVQVADGDAVEAGAPLLSVEAMKMEHVLAAPIGGTLEVLVSVGDQVVVDQVLARVQAAGEP